MSRKRHHYSIVSLLLICLFSFCLAACEPSKVTAHVVEVIDGDTIIVDSTDGRLTVRLLNIDTPETKHPNRAIECLGPEASRFLTNKLPAGTEVKLAFDKERTDKYGRTLAGVYLKNELINAEIARQGLGVPIVVGANSKFYPPVQAASIEARFAGRGLFSPDADCTPAGLAQQYESLSTESSRVLTTGSKDTKKLLTKTSLLRSIIQAWFESQTSDAQSYDYLKSSRKYLFDQTRDKYGKPIDFPLISGKLSSLESRIRVIQDEQSQKTSETKSVPQSQIQNSPPTQTYPQPQSQSAPQPKPQPQPAPQPPQSQTRGGSGSKYTGCRAYGGKYPPNDVDDKGRPFTRIDCSTKRPI